MPKMKNNLNSPNLKFGVEIDCYVQDTQIITRVRNRCTNQVRNMGLHLEANVLGIHLSGKITIYRVLPRASTSSKHCHQVVDGFCPETESYSEELCN